jgi:drug/metabolite transporter (DMT)-like permease
MSGPRAVWDWILGRPYLLLVFTMVMWGGNAVASRLAVSHISPMALTCLRWLAVCLIIAPLLGREAAVHGQALVARWPYIVFMAALGFVAFNALMYAAAHHTPAVNLTILQGAFPVFVLLGGFGWLGIRIRLVQLLGVTVTLVGVAIVATRGELEALATLSFNTGDVWMILACVAYAAYTLLLRQRPGVPGFVFVAAMSGSAFLLSMPLLAFEMVTGTIEWPDGIGFAIVLYVALFPTLLSQLFFMRGVELIGAARAGLFVNLVPVFGAILAMGILGEPLRSYHILALVLVLGGIWVAERNRASAA